MRRLAVLTWLTLALSVEGAVVDHFIDFHQYRFGLPPKEFDYDATGPHGPVLSAGRPMWRAYIDLFAPSPKLVLIQASARQEPDHFAIAVLRDVTLDNVKLAVAVKLVSGSFSRSAGLFWRAQDRNNYCAALVDGQNHQLLYLRIREGKANVLAKGTLTCDVQQWNALEVAAQEDSVRVWLNERLVLEARDRTFTAPGRLGLITHADTTASFDDFYVQSGVGRVVRRPRLAPEPVPATGSRPTRY
jgi:hypothetical protein